MIWLLGFVLNARGVTAPVSGTAMHSVVENYLPSPLKLASGTRFDPCSCISYAKAITGHTGQIWGNASDLEANSDIPWPGDLILLNEGRVGHVAVILKTVGEDIYITESNYISCTVSQRVINIHDPKIRGYRVP